MIVQAGLGVQLERGGIEMRKCLLTARAMFCWCLGSMPASGGEGYFALAMEWLLWGEIHVPLRRPLLGRFPPF